MASDISYERPTITEAVCEFRFLASDAWDATIPGLIYSELRGAFPEKVMGHRFQMQPAADGPAVRVENLVQLRHREYGERAFVQISMHYLSVHNIAPYLGWPIFQPLIRAGLEAYVNTAHPTDFQRIGLRYLNKIEPPLNTDFSEYLTFYPYLGPELPQQLGAFDVTTLTEFVADARTDQLRLALRSDNSKPESTAVILDLDYFTPTSGLVPINQGLDWVASAHEHLRSTFENCLTPAMKRRLGRHPEMVPR